MHLIEKKKTEVLFLKVRFLNFKFENTSISCIATVALARRVRSDRGADLNCLFVTFDGRSFGGSDFCVYLCVWDE